MRIPGESQSQQYVRYMKIKIRAKIIPSTQVERNQRELNCFFCTKKVTADWVIQLYGGSAPKEYICQDCYEDTLAGRELH